MTWDVQDQEATAGEAEPSWQRSTCRAGHSAVTKTTNSARSVWSSRALPLAFGRRERAWRATVSGVIAWLLAVHAHALLLLLSLAAVIVGAVKQDEHDGERETARARRARTHAHFEEERC